MKIIDAHLHFSNREGFKKTAAEIGQVNYSAEGLKREFQEAGVVAGVVMTTSERGDSKSSGDSMELVLEDGTLDCLLTCVGINPVLLQEGSSELLNIEKQLNQR